ncbi:MAG: DUF3180 domain-containing protein [Microbacterium sp.]|uniref:DUF3180 domain-containing protein n=1 Tax=Microbacterium sp. TaxID=51671 RepID=UPI001AC83521|nr:DUF3180 domain-containing protein [Microbacterium sp.]MBN9155573.1 DUF3180 domain-containing protein [Microbacterium sp.]MBN9175503.1 DUF3180 domain-containing protein [Microbacterium sp.]
MKRTGAGVLIVAGVLGVGAGFLLDQLLTAAGRPTFTPMVSLPILLIAVGVVDIALAIPIYRTSRGHSTAPVNPFRAVRIAMLAKASSIVGAAVGGMGLGLLVFLLTRPTTPSVGSVSAVVATAVCGAVLVAAGLVAEHLCTIRKDDDDEQPGVPGLDTHDR